MATTTLVLRDTSMHRPRSNITVDYRGTNRKGTRKSEIVSFGKQLPVVAVPDEEL